MAENNLMDFVTKNFGSEANLNNLLGSLKGMDESLVSGFITKNFGSNDKFASAIAVLKSFGKVSDADIKLWPAMLQKLVGNLNVADIAGKVLGSSEVKKGLNSVLGNLFKK